MTQNFTGQDLRGKSFKGQDLTGANFSNADIRGTDFSNAILTDANFSGVKAGMRSLPLVRFAAISLLILATILLIFVKNYLFAPPPTDAYGEEIQLGGYFMYRYPATMAGAAPGAIATVLGAFLANRIAPGNQSARSKIGRGRFVLKRLANLEIIAALIGLVLSAIALRDIAIIYALTWNFDSVIIYGPGEGALLGTLTALLGILAGTGAFTISKIRNRWKAGILWVVFFAVGLTLFLSKTLARLAGVSFSHDLFYTPRLLLFFLTSIPISPETSPGGMSGFYPSERLIGLYIGCAFVVLISVLFGMLAGITKKNALLITFIIFCVNLGTIPSSTIFSAPDNISRIYWIAILFMPACYSYIITFASDRTSFYKANLRNADFSGAKLKHANFKEAIIEDTNFSKAKL